MVADSDEEEPWFGDEGPDADAPAATFSDEEEEGAFDFPEAGLSANIRDILRHLAADPISNRYDLWRLPHPWRMTLLSQAVHGEVQAQSFRHLEHQRAQAHKTIMEIEDSACVQILSSADIIGATSSGVPRFILFLCCLSFCFQWGGD